MKILSTLTSGFFIFLVQILSFASALATEHDLIDHSKKEGEDFGRTARELVGRGEFEPPANITSSDMNIASSLASGVNALMGISVGIATAALIMGGIMWASAAGDDERIEKAKKYIKYSLFGLVLSLSAWTISNVVMNNFA